MKDLILAHDIGTTGDKACAFNAEGECVASAYAAYATNYAPGGRAEQEPEDWWQAVIRATREITREIDAEDIACVSFSGQMMGLICLDAEGRVLRPSMIHSDSRATLENADFHEKMSEWDLYRVTGHVPSAHFPLQKLRWLKAHEPDIYQKTACVLQAKDYIIYRFTGVLGSELTDAAATNLLDIEKRAWSEKIIGLAELDGEKLPALRKSADIVGEVHAEAARETGLLPGTPVAAGSADGTCASVGCGVVRPGAVYNYIGSSSWICGLSEKPIFSPEYYVESSLHPVDEYYHCGGTMNAAGACYAWAAEALYGGRDDDRILYDISQTSPGAGNMLFLPYLRGERVPWWNPEARGSFIGLRGETSRGDMMRAVLEGVAMNLKFPLDTLREHFPVTDITLLGGGANNPAWNHIMADIYGATLYIMRDSELATSRGAAIVGGVGIGMFKDYGAARDMFAVSRTVRPSAENAAYYAKLFELFRAGYAGTRETMEGLARLER